MGSGYIFFMIFESSTTIDIEKCRPDLKKILLIFKNTSNIFKKRPKHKKLSRPIVKIVVIAESKS